MYRNVRTPDLVLLWARAAGLCSHPDCKIPLVLDGHHDDPSVTLGHAAHIVAHSPQGPRGAAPSPLARNAYPNLILLCGYHHAMIDRAATRFPAGHLHAWKAEHEAWVRHVTRAPSPAVPWTAIFLDPAASIDRPHALDALGPGNTAAETLDLPADPDAARDVLLSAVAATPEDRRRFAVFSLAPIPLSIQCGFLLSDRARAALFHYHRDRASWHWPPPAAAVPDDLAIHVRRTRSRLPEAVLRVSLSAQVRDVPVTAATDIEIAAPAPSLRWLQHEPQLAALARAVESALARIRDRGARRVHLFFAGPGAAAVAVGRAYNPRMNPELVLYDFHRGRYTEALRLT